MGRGGGTLLTVSLDRAPCVALLVRTGKLCLHAGCTRLNTGLRTSGHEIGFLFTYLVFFRYVFYRDPHSRHSRQDEDMGNSSAYMSL